jgi:FKBP-type peptidyl-prolyl cis-trans isomerase FklB
MDLGTSLRQRSIQLDPALFNQGLKDGMSGAKTLITLEQARAAIRELQKDQRERQIARDKQDGEAFLAKNKSEEGVVTLESGLQFKVLHAGTGKKPTIDNTVVCHYRGTLIDGTEFSNSYPKNQPATLAVRKAAKGWSEALQLMPAGSKWKLFIPPHLVTPEAGTEKGYKETATLIFELELVSIVER